MSGSGDGKEDASPGDDAPSEDGEGVGNCMGEPAPEAVEEKVAEDSTAAAPAQEAKKDDAQKSKWSLLLELESLNLDHSPVFCVLQEHLRMAKEIEKHQLVNDFAPVGALLGFP
jgi:hypothetical protein